MDARITRTLPDPSTFNVKEVRLTLTPEEFRIIRHAVKELAPSISLDVPFEKVRALHRALHEVNF